MKTKKMNALIVLLLMVVMTTTSCAKNSVKTYAANKTETPAKTTAQNSVQTTPTIKRVEAEEFKTATKGKEVQLVDIRTPREFASGHLKNAENINVFDKSFMEKMAKYKKDEPIYVYCRSGSRSMTAAKKLKAKGFNVVNLNRGIIGWRKKSFEVVK